MHLVFDQRLEEKGERSQDLTGSVKGLPGFPILHPFLKFPESSFDRVCNPIPGTTACATAAAGNPIGSSCPISLP